MDIADRAIFILAVAEHNIFKTPKEVLINEAIELARRYGDD
jgi:transcription termination factor NusB